MAFNVNVVNSCKLLTVNGDRYDSTSLTADIILTHIGTGTSTTVVMNYNNSTGKGKINIPVSNLTAPLGVYKVCVEEQGVEYGCRPVLIHCDIDCCLTKLTNELLDCACDCPRCSVALAKAQKVFLLLQSAIATVDIAGAEALSNGYYQDIEKKYKKAREICDNSCGCNC